MVDLIQLDRRWATVPVGVLRSPALPFDRLAAFDCTRVLAQPPGEARDERIRNLARQAFSAFVNDPVFHTALAWQNPEAIGTWMAACLAAGPTPTQVPHRFSQRAAVVARYAQRYCAKNDTIGFFGPVAWARIGEGPTRAHGGGGLVRREIFFESWAIEAIARHWNSSPQLWEHLPVRVDPSCTVDGGQARLPRRPEVVLTREQERLIELIPKAGSVRELLRMSADTNDSASRALRDLMRQGVVRVGFLVPLDSRPEVRLAEQIAGIADARVRSGLLGDLRLLDRSRGELAAAGDLTSTIIALKGVEAALEHCAGSPVRREAASAGGGRTPVYLDTRRDLDAVIGRADLAALAPALSIALDSAHWLAGQIGAEAHRRLLALHRRLAATRHRVTLADLQIVAAQVLDPGAAWVRDVLHDFQARWAEIVPHSPAAVVAVDVEHARRLADVLFAPQGVWWASARTHTPDLMPRRVGDEIRWVLGELHVALNTLESRFFRAMADDPAALVAAMNAHATPGRVVPVYPNSSVAVSARSYPPPGLDPPGGHRYWSFGSDDGHPEGHASSAATGITVHEANGGLLAVCARDGWQAPVIECFGEFLSALAVNLFRPRAPRPYHPRVEIGPLTLCRRSWTVPVARMGPLPSHAKDPAQAAVRSWAAGHGLPRHLFVRTAVEPKPFYADQNSPMLMDNLARAARRIARSAGAAAELELTEMLPAPDELWLTHNGERYTSELRFVAVATAQGQAASWPAADV